MIITHGDPSKVDIFYKWPITCYSWNTN